MRRGNDAVVVAMAVRGSSLAEIAESTGLSISSVQRRLADPELATMVREERQAQVDKMVGQLGELTQAACSRLGELIAHDDAAIALRASIQVLGSTLRAVEVQAVTSRLTALEAAMGAMEPGRRDS